MPLLMPMLADETYFILVQEMSVAKLNADCMMSGRIRFRKCTFLGADFSRSGLTVVKFESCNLQYANFTGSHLIDVIFENCDLRGLTFAPHYMNAATKDSLLNGGNLLDPSVRLYIQWLGVDTEWEDEEDGEDG